MRKIVLAAAAAGVALTLAGCGSKPAEDASSEAPAMSDTAAATDAAATDTAAATDAAATDTAASSDAASD
jgi:uncharacterized protein YceK